MAGQQLCCHGVKVAIAPAPEVQVMHHGRRCQSAGLSRCQRCCVAVDPAHDAAFHVPDLRLVFNRLRRALLVAHLRFNVDPGAAPMYIEVAGPHIHPCGPKLRVERQCLVELARHMQPHALADATVVGIEIRVVPVIRGASRLLLVVPVVVRSHRQHVFSWSRLHGIGDVEAERHHAVFVSSDKFAVQVNFACLTNALKLQEDLSRTQRGQTEVLAIPRDADRQIVNADPES